MRLLVRVVARDRLRWFALYCAVVGGVSFACGLRV
jgi:undecaprenyl pyrophosphate phosphatase UppP